MKKYFTHNGVKEEGPFTLAELSSKGIKADTPIWFDGLTNWTVASLIPELEPLLAPKPKPAPIPPPFKQQKVAPPVVNQPKVAAPAPRQQKAKPTSNLAVEEEKEGKTNFKVYLWVLGLTLAFFIFVITKSDDARLPAMAQEQVEEDTVAVERTEEQERDQALENDKMIARNDWASNVKATSSDFEVDELGGISRLEVTVSNKLDYPLDEVKVAVKYIKENGGLFKTEYLKIEDVPANGKASMPAPDSNRGTSVKLEIVGARSKELEFCYDAEVEYTSAEDPYRCR
ncbi:DUF4339 domain-containing protein [Desertivirga arenae]|uniref:DUF4339 domain-containing protein n=1 Tax=Desertivirga arenae TaxID=2810309 RepID=UPI001A9719EA|nr:DUF4339 domain-containing protein [Pedobacter sp. SYSU D00823]